jgi:hypothetical protein
MIPTIDKPVKKEQNLNQKRQKEYKKLEFVLSDN